MAKYRKDVEVLVKKAEQAGWTTDQSPGKHPKLYPTDKQFSPIVVPISMSDHRGYMNFRSQLRKAGLDC